MKNTPSALKWLAEKRGRLAHDLAVTQAIAQDVNLLNLYPPGYVAQFLLMASEREMTPLEATRIGPNLAGIAGFFERLHPPYFVQPLLALLEPTHTA